MNSCEHTAQPSISPVLPEISKASRMQSGAKALAMVRMNTRRSSRNDSLAATMVETMASA